MSFFNVVVCDKFRLKECPGKCHDVLFVDNCFAICPRQALHAKTLGFIHPTTKKEMFFDTELPKDMKEVIEKWRNYSSTIGNKQ